MGKWVNIGREKAACWTYQPSHRICFNHKNAPILTKLGSHVQLFSPVHPVATTAAPAPIRSICVNFTANVPVLNL